MFTQFDVLNSYYHCKGHLWHLFLMTRSTRKTTWMIQYRGSLRLPRAIGRSTARGPPFQRDLCIRYFFNAQPHAQKDHDGNENFVIYTVHWARSIARIFRWGAGEKILWGLRGREAPDPCRWVGSILPRENFKIYTEMEQF